MAAAKNVYQLPESHNSVPRHGVLTLFGYGIQVFIDRGHLSIEDGIGTERYRYRLPRIGHGLRRLVVIGSDGMVSLAALRWLADQDVAFVMLDRDGSVLVTTGPVRASDARLRRAQALASQSGTAIRVARELIDKKLAGQEQVARHKLLAPENAAAIHRYRSELAEAETPERVRLIESQAASAYWAAWRTLTITFPRKDEARVPDHWRVFGARISPLTGSPRLAANPANAILNYLYAVLESESRLAAASLGLDPGIGVLHVDAPYRDSLACDLMEPVRAQIDAFLLDWVSREPLKREWFFEQRDGNCRLRGSFAAQLSETAPTWGRAVAPFAEWVAQSLRTPGRKPASKDQTVPTRLTQRRRGEGRGNEFVPSSPIAQRPPKICAVCGVSLKRGRYCGTCASEVSREKLIAFGPVARVTAQSEEAQKARTETQKIHAAEIRLWIDSGSRTQVDETTYLTKVQPKLASVTVSAISLALRISEPYARDIRAGRRRPHLRHWQALAKLIRIDASD
ncbi:MAG: CRISPR-associated endonuclease Cas1 [Acidobacteriia bacterium]|nr:CRISPR-associated endonuclease Cas1 [Terriglobia bacterium]